MRLKPSRSNGSETWHLWSLLAECLLLWSNFDASLFASIGHSSCSFTIDVKVEARSFCASEKMYIDHHLLILRQEELSRTTGGQCLTKSQLHMVGESEYHPKVKLEWRSGKMCKVATTALYQLH